ncbi:MAG: dienelactone hydrolase family protein [Proteobacteria bacterium]|nr:dienelactone hydrolase family protein [Pseudomonadota bacterium]MBI3497622.1 dienelactone hydrolase family protein [Pseudomonadota bacterium]
MSETITLTASDGFKLGCYIARPQGKPKAGLVVIQEIFGVNNHMRGVADGFAKDGYLAVTPAIFDRVKPGIELGYGPDDVAKGRDIRGATDLDKVMLDLAAAVKQAKPAGKVGVVGYCWGGTLAFLGGQRLGVDAAVGYYGGGMVPFADAKTTAPTMLHFGEKDTGIPLSDVEIVRKKRPEVEIHLYPAGHGFNCDERGSYDASATKLARERTIAFFKKHLG